MGFLLGCTQLNVEGTFCIADELAPCGEVSRKSVETVEKVYLEQTNSTQNIMIVLRYTEGKSCHSGCCVAHRCV